MGAMVGAKVLQRKVLVSQILLVQSSPTRQLCPGTHTNNAYAQLPPQSTSVSSPSLYPDLQCAGVGAAVGADVGGVGCCVGAGVGAGVLHSPQVQI